MKKIIVITGASSGIGFESAKLFKQNGDIVINISRETCPIADKNFVCELDNREMVAKIFEDIKDEFDHIDVLLNNAGFGMSGVTELVDFEKSKNLFDVNFFAKLQCIQLALPLMIRGSKIINTSSAMALMSVPFRSLYGASKSAVLNLSLALRMEVLPYGIDVVAVCPGNTKSGFTKNRVKNFETNSRYGDRQKLATEKIDKGDDDRMSASYVASQYFRIANKKKNKPMIIIGRKYKVLYFLSKIFPKSWFLHFTNKSLGGI